MQWVQVAGGFGTEEFISQDVQPGKAFYLMAQLCRETESGAEPLSVPKPSPITSPAPEGPLDAARFVIRVDMAVFDHQ